MKKVITLGFIFLIFLFSFFYISSTRKNYISKNIQVLATSGIETEKKINEISLEFHYKVNIYYPYTSYSNLNKEIENLVGKWLDQLEVAVKEGINLEDQFYTLDIHYDAYNYQNYISYVFTCFLDTGGAHPNTYIETISFDKEKNNLFTIDSFQKTNINILSRFSEISRKELYQNKKLLDSNVWNMVLEGTRPIDKNFQNFAFSEKGVIVFFERYQIAPYSYGSYQVIIPYSQINF